MSRLAMSRVLTPFALWRLPENTASCMHWRAGGRGDAGRRGGQAIACPARGLPVGLHHRRRQVGSQLALDADGAGTGAAAAVGGGERLVQVQMYPIEAHIAEAGAGPRG